MNTTILPIEVMTLETVKTDYYLVIYLLLGFMVVMFCNFSLFIRVLKYKQTIRRLIQMDELKKQTMNIIKNMEQDMVDRIKTAQDTGEGIDLMSRNAKIMELLEKLDTAFIEAKVRVVNNKGKRGWLG